MRRTLLVRPDNLHDRVPDPCTAGICRETISEAAQRVKSSQGPSANLAEVFGALKPDDAKRSGYAAYSNDSQGSLVKNFRVALFFRKDKWGHTPPAGESFTLRAKQRNLGPKSPI
jgi:hypothetical protein